MTPFLFFCLKMSLCIAILEMFYQLVLRKLTFFNSIRWYFILGIISSALISIISFQEPSTQHAYFKVINYVPSIQSIPSGNSNWINHVDFYQVLTFTWVIGVILLLTKLVIQFISFIQLKKSSSKVNQHQISIYHTGHSINPFSFGTSIFINPVNINQKDYENIIAHEWIHIKQLHSMDMLLAEFLIIINWFNPFSWLLKRSIRQNLEFLTDDLMLQKVTDAKAYQYLLLRSLGHTTYSFAPTFNFHSLKSRIIMMNLSKSNRLRKLSFLLIAPLTLLLIFSFRVKSTEKPENKIVKNERTPAPGLKPLLKQDAIPVQKNDTTPARKVIKRNDEGTHMWSHSDDGDKNVKRVEIYGETGKGDVATVYLRNGNKEVFDLSNDKTREAFEDKYGYLIPIVPPIPPIPPMPPMPSIPPMPPMPPMPSIPPIPPMPPMPSIPPVPPIPPFDFNLPDNVSEITINEKTINIKLKDGTKEIYDLTDPAQKRKFREKYGDIREE